MVADGTYTAVLDRFEDGRAVLVLQQDGTDVADYPVERSVVPSAGRHQDAVFEVVTKDGVLTNLTYDAEMTEQRREAAQERFDRLSQRPPKDEDKDEQ